MKELLGTVSDGNIAERTADAADRKMTWEKKNRKQTCENLRIDVRLSKRREKDQL